MTTKAKFGIAATLVILATGWITKDFIGGKTDDVLESDTDRRGFESARDAADTPRRATTIDDAEPQRATPPMNRPPTNPSLLRGDVAESAATVFVELVVVRARDGRPVPEAEVSWPGGARRSRMTSTSTVVDQLPAPYGSSVGFSAIERNGHAATTDAEGRVRVPLPYKGTQRVVVAKSGHLWGFARIDSETEPGSTIELVPDRSLVIEVVDEAGQVVAGVPVRLGYSIARDMRNAFWRGETGPNGRATAKHLQLQSLFAMRAVDAEIGLPLASPVRKRVDLQNPSKQPIRLVLPRALGRLEVEVRDTAGRLISDAAFVGIGNVVLAGHHSAPGAKTFHWAALEEGKAHFETVGAGTEFDVCVQFPDDDRADVVETVRGPERPGRRAEFASRSVIASPFS